MLDDLLRQIETQLQLFLELVDLRVFTSGARLGNLVLRAHDLEDARVDATRSAEHVRALALR